ncbi:tannase and feruloyl esterase [Aureobasidium pullulans]|uniref:Carboxylic ester hydrolase n=1 Tax=Aureobasidium pullulans TaxID=5580 RepID=A0A4T0BM72_AURPU|nr:tannase and feruloyl esterase [Aureobasidium pullulans]
MAPLFNILSFLVSAETTTQSVLAVPTTQNFAHSSCHPGSFSFPTIPGAELINISASSVLNYTRTSLLPGTEETKSYTIDFCNVTVTYKHISHNESINVSIWAPKPDDWNRRILALGGGGYAATFDHLYQTAAAGKEFVAIDTDSGHSSGMTSAFDTSWALDADGKINTHLIQDWGFRTLGEMSVIGKHIVEEYYNRLPDYAYFTGCSGGGRQGLVLAQRYPNAFDGILAAAPAINLETFIPAAYWPTQVMRGLKVYPAPCEIEEFTKAAIQQCDALDGDEDGIISMPESCLFEASTLIGREFSCDGEQRRFTKEAAMVVEAAWNGVHGQGVEWYGLNKDADLTQSAITTSCNTGTEDCRYDNHNRDLFNPWFRSFAAKDSEFDVGNMNTSTFFSLLSTSIIEFRNAVGADDPDLRAFQAAGGKMISWHGMADTIIPPAGTTAYYQRVLQATNNTIDFYRHFETPGVGHCVSGAAGLPERALGQLMAWVERGKEPEVLLASKNGSNISLCPWPKRRVYVGPDPKVVGSFICA